MEFSVELIMALFGGALMSVALFSCIVLVLLVLRVGAWSARPIGLFVGVFLALFIGVQLADLTRGLPSGPATANATELLQGELTFLSRLREQGWLIAWVFDIVGWLVDIASERFAASGSFRGASAAVIANLVGLLCYAALRSVIVPAAAGWSLVRRWRAARLREPAPPYSSDAVFSGFHTPMMARAIGAALLTLIVVVVAAPVAFPAAEAIGLGASVHTGAAYTGFIWSPCLIVLAEAWLMIRPAPTDPATADRVAAPGPPAAPLPLQAVYDDYLTRFADHITLSADEPASRPPAEHAPTTATFLPPSAASRLDPQSLTEIAELYDGVATGRSHGLVVGSISELHFQVIASLIQRVNDGGGATLLVAPESSVEQTKARLVRSMGPYSANVMLRWVSMKSAVDAKLADVLYGCEHDFERSVLARGGGFEAPLQQLRLVAVIGLDSLDVAQLRIKLERLWTRIQKRDVTFICQSRERMGLESHIKNVFDPGGPRPFLKMLHRPAATKRRFTLAWRDSPEAARDLAAATLGGLRSDQPRELMPVAALPAIAHGVEVATLDPSGAYDVADWRKCQDVMAQSPTWTGPAALSQPRRTLAGDGADRVAFIEDREHLVDAVNTDLDAPLDAPETMLHVVSRRYPMREYFAQKAQQGPLTQNDFRAILPLFPDPHNDVSQIAFFLVDELAERREGLTRAEVSRWLSQLAHHDVLSQLGVSASQEGLNRLFERVLNLNLSVQRDVNANHEVTFSLASTDKERARVALMIDVSAGGNPVAELPQGDEGLTFASETPLCVDGEHFRVQSVAHESGDDQDRQRALQAQVSHQHYFSRGGFLARPQIVFSRSYRLEPIAEVLTEQQRLSAAGDLAVLANLSFQRSADSYLQLESNAPLLRPDRRLDLRKTSRVITTARAFQPVVYLRRSLGEGAPDPRVAFTLAATLQDVLLSIAPRTNAPRVAVVSPTAAPHIRGLRDADPAADTAEGVAARFYPMMAELEPGVSDALFGAGRGAARYEFFVLEDAPTDMGVARSAYRGVDDIEHEWRSYVRWLAASEIDAAWRSLARLALDLPDDLGVDIETIAELAALFAPEHAKTIGFVAEIIGLTPLKALFSSETWRAELARRAEAGPREPLFHAFGAAETTAFDFSGAERALAR